METDDSVYMLTVPADSWAAGGDLPSRPVPASRRASVAEAAAVPRVVPAPVGLDTVAYVSGGSPAGDGSGTPPGRTVDAGWVGDLTAAAVSGAVPTSELLRRGSVIPVPVP